MSETKKRRQPNPGDWWGIGLLLMTLGLGGLAYGIGHSAAGGAMLVAALATSVGLFLVVGAAVTFGIRYAGAVSGTTGRD